MNVGWTRAREEARLIVTAQAKSLPSFPAQSDLHGPFGFQSVNSQLQM